MCRIINVDEVYDLDTEKGISELVRYHLKNNRNVNTEHYFDDICNEYMLPRMGWCTGDIKKIIRHELTMWKLDNLEKNILQLYELLDNKGKK